MLLLLLPFMLHPHLECLDLLELVLVLGLLCLLGLLGLLCLLCMLSLLCRLGLLQLCLQCQHWEEVEVPA